MNSEKKYPKHLRNLEDSKVNRLFKEVQGNLEALLHMTNPDVDATPSDRREAILSASKKIKELEAEVNQ